MSRVPQWRLRLKTGFSVLEDLPAQEPALVSVPTFSTVEVAVEDSGFDVSIPMDNVGTKGALRCQAKDGAKTYNIGVYIRLGRGKYQRYAPHPVCLVG